MKREILLGVIIVLFLAGVNAVSESEKSQDGFSVQISGNENNKGYGQVFGWYGKYVQVNALNLEENKEYTLVYYEEKVSGILRSGQGSSYRNVPSDRAREQIRVGGNTGSSYSSQRYPKVYCVSHENSGENGMFSKVAEFSYVNLLKDKKNQVFMLVPSETLSCKKGKLFSMNSDLIIIADKKV